MNQPAPDNHTPLPPPGKLIATAEVISLADHAAKRAEKLGTVIAGLEAGIAKRGEEAAASAAAAGFAPEDQQSAARKVTAKARAEVAANSEDTRWGYIREVNAAAESVALTAALFASPQAVLARAGLGTPERTHYQQQLEGSGIVQIKNMAALAVATNNKVLGAAIMAVLDRMPRRERPISTAELAERLVGEETRQVQDAITRIKLAAQSAININREFTTGKVRPLDRVKLALNKKEA
jgi:hypothetical protein